MIEARGSSLSKKREQPARVAAVAYTFSMSVIAVARDIS